MSARIRCTADLNLYFDRTVGNDGNDGLAAGAGHALATLQRAWELAANEYDLAGYGLNIWQSGGLITYTNAGLFTRQGIIGAKGPRFIKLDMGGATFDRSDGSYNFAGGSILDEDNALDVKFLLQNVRMTASNGGAIFSNGATIILGPGIDFGPVTACHMQTVGGSGIYIPNSPTFPNPGGYKISGGASLHASAQSSSYITAQRLQIHGDGLAHNFSQFANAQFCGQAYFQLSTFLNCGLFTGQRFNGSLNGVFATASGNLNFFPGNVAGALSTGAQYA